MSVGLKNAIRTADRNGLPQISERPEASFCSIPCKRAKRNAPVIPVAPYTREG